jgi:hypothetical protein
MNDRDTFAAAALTGLLADDGDRIDHAMSDFTRRSYEWADAMLRERGGEPTNTTLTNVERSAIAFAIRFLQPVGNYDSLALLTLRRLLERTE